MENFIIALILVVIFSVIYLIIYTYSHINNKRNSKQQQNKDKPYYCMADMKNKDSVDTKDLKNNDNNSNESISNESKNQSNYNYYKNKCCPVDPDIQNLIEQKISEIRSFISSQNFKIAKTPAEDIIITKLIAEAKLIAQRLIKMQGFSSADEKLIRTSIPDPFFAGINDNQLFKDMIILEMKMIEAQSQRNQEWTVFDYGYIFIEAGFGVRDRKFIIQTCTDLLKLSSSDAHFIAIELIDMIERADPLKAAYIQTLRECDQIVSPPEAESIDDKYRLSFEKMGRLNLVIADMLRDNDMVMPKEVKDFLINTCQFSEQQVSFLTRMVASYCDKNSDDYKFLHKLDIVTNKINAQAYMLRQHYPKLYLSAGASLKDRVEYLYSHGYVAMNDEGWIRSNKYTLGLVNSVDQLIIELAKLNSEDIVTAFIEDYTLSNHDESMMRCLLKSRWNFSETQVNRIILFAKLSVTSNKLANGIIYIDRDAINSYLDNDHLCFNRNFLLTNEEVQHIANLIASKVLNKSSANNTTVKSNNQNNDSTTAQKTESTFDQGKELETTIEIFKCFEKRSTTKTVLSKPSNTETKSGTQNESKATSLNKLTEVHADAATSSTENAERSLKTFNKDIRSNESTASTNTPKTESTFDIRKAFEGVGKRSTIEETVINKTSNTATKFNTKQNTQVTQRKNYGNSRLNQLLQKAIETNNLRYDDLKPNWEECLDILEHNGIDKLYHFTSEKNLTKIKEAGGLLSWYASEQNNIDVPVYGGDFLSRKLDRNYGNHDYVHLSFCEDHPMAYRLKQQGENVVLLEISPIVAVLKESLFSDMNAADKAHHQGADIESLKRINFEATKERFVSRDSEYFKPHQAEVMVRTMVPLYFICNLEELIQKSAATAVFRRANPRFDINEF